MGVYTALKGMVGVYCTQRHGGTKRVKKQKKFLVFRKKEQVKSCIRRLRNPPPPKFGQRY